LKAIKLNCTSITTTIHFIYTSWPERQAEQSAVLVAVCCVNFLYPFAHQPQALASLLRPVEAGQYMTFEWIGERDYLNEAKSAADLVSVLHLARNHCGALRVGRWKVGAKAANRR
jgi:hypothetical protein